MIRIKGSADWIKSEDGLGVYLTPSKENADVFATVEDAENFIKKVQERFPGNALSVDDDGEDDDLELEDEDEDFDDEDED